MINVFTDYHHGDLYYAMHLLFEQRLGFSLYRPIGLEWFQNGYWRIAEPYGNAQGTINQYLAINQLGWHPYKNLNGEHYIEDGVYYVHDPGHGYYQKAITLDKFASMHFGVIMPTYEPHEGPYVNLRDRYQQKAKLVAQLGNTGQRSSLSHVIHSVPYTPRPGQAAVLCHQEIDPDLYKYVPPNHASKKIFSMVNCLPYAGVYDQYKGALSEVEMRAYGAGSPDGPLSGSATVSVKMQEANIGWHLKPQDGIGHTAMGWFASGRPVITNMSQVLGWGGAALSLFEPGVTCLNIEGGTVESNCAAIRRMLEPDENLRWAERCLKRFGEVVNYDREAERVRAMLEGVV